jgi:cytochrome P450
MPAGNPTDWAAAFEGQRQSAQAPLDWQPEDPSTLANPYALFARMREEDPCHWSARLKGWVLTRYDDVRNICFDRDALHSSDRLRPYFATLAPPEAGRVAGIVRYLSQWMVFKDPPDHTRLRRVLSQVFNPRSFQAMRPRIGSIAAGLLHALDDREYLDVIADFAGPLPCLVIMAMLGVPACDLHQIKRMSDDVALFIGSSRTSPAKYDAAEAATGELAEYFLALIAQRRREPGEDLLSALVHLPPDADVAPLSEDELVGSCIMLLFAGHETTTNHIANGVAALMDHPSEMDRLREDPSLIGSAVEELLRYEGPSGAQVRVVRQDHSLHGRSLEEGQRVFLMLNAANRDPRAFEEPDRLDLSRRGPQHLAFGLGPHMCLGLALARTEGQIAIPALLANYTTLEPAGDVPMWINSLVFRGMHSLPVRVRRA